MDSVSFNQLSHRGAQDSVSCNIHSDAETEVLLLLFYYKGRETERVLLPT